MALAPLVSGQAWVTEGGRKGQGGTSAGRRFPRGKRDGNAGISVRISREIRPASRHPRHDRRRHRAGPAASRSLASPGRAPCPRRCAQPPVGRIVVLPDQRLRQVGQTALRPAGQASRPPPHVPHEARRPFNRSVSAGTSAARSAYSRARKARARLHRGLHHDARTVLHRGPERGRQAQRPDPGAFGLHQHGARGVECVERLHERRLEPLLRGLRPLHVAEDRAPVPRQPFEVDHLPAERRDLREAPSSRCRYSRRAGSAGARVRHRRAVPPPAAATCDSRPPAPPPASRSGSGSTRRTPTAARRASNRPAAASRPRGPSADPRYGARRSAPPAPRRSCGRGTGFPACRSCRPRRVPHRSGPAWTRRPAGGPRRIPRGCARR
jgi:hypothetical protein